MPLSGRPLRMTWPIKSPFTSCATREERTRSGPRAPVASAPWQKPHDCSKRLRPLSIAAAVSVGAGVCGAAWAHAAEFAPLHSRTIPILAIRKAGTRHFAAASQLRIDPPQPHVFYIASEMRSIPQEGSLLFVMTLCDDVV